MMKLLILGAGTGGTIIANRMRKLLPVNKWQIIVIDKQTNHYYQPGYLFVPFGYYKEKDIVKPTKKYLHNGIDLITSEIEQVDAEKNKVVLKNGDQLDYDFLVIATGAALAPEDTPGLKADLWQKQIFDFYTPEGAMALYEFFKTWERGNLVIDVAELPIKCPIAPLEFVMYADDFFSNKGIRNRVKITYVTPMSGAFTKPMASKMLGRLLENKNISIVPDFSLAEVDNSGKKIIDYAGKEINFDVLISIPLHKGENFIGKSGLGDDLDFVVTDKHTLQSKKSANIFALGDAANIPASKAGSVVHFESEILQENLICAIQNKPFKASFDGHANCFIESGRGKGVLIDFNYDTEPLPGLFPFPLFGPLRLLKESRMNHFGKLAFKWIYWNMLLEGKNIPFVPAKMKMIGKRVSPKLLNSKSND